MNNELEVILIMIFNVSTHHWTQFPNVETFLLKIGCTITVIDFSLSVQQYLFQTQPEDGSSALLLKLLAQEAEHKKLVCTSEFHCNQCLRK